MSSVNVLIGVGGTGAKVVESALFCALAGFGPSDLAVAFVDQDGGNGNVDRSRSLLRAIEQFRALWYNDSRPDHIKPAQGQTSLGSARVRPVAPSDPLWCPHPAGTTLADILSADAVSREEPQLKALMDVLFTADRSEQFMELSLGYRGRAHVGSAAFLSKMGEDEPFWQAMTDTLKRGQSGQEVRIFLVGSVFGGTGAAGFPTLARKLRRMAEAADGARVRIGGALMLPYFGFNRAEDPAANVAKQEDLLLQSEEALRYYGDLFEREGRTFDELYLTGWSPFFQLGYHSAGSKSQANPPLPPELIAATGAVRFFRGQGGGDGRNSVFVSSRHDKNRLGWSDLPGPTDAEAALPYVKLGQLLRFCTAWRNTIRPSLKGKLFGNDPWFKRQGCGKSKQDHPQTRENLDALDGLVTRILQWAAATQLYGTTNQFGPPGVREFQLWDVSPQAVFPDPIAPEHVTAPVTLREPLSGDAAAEAYKRVVWARAESEPAPQSVLFDTLNERARPGDHGGFGRIVDAVFHAAAVEPEREPA